MRKYNRLSLIGITMLLPGFLFYLYYLYKIVIFPFEWEPTDGDHLNFAHRLHSNLTIYFQFDSGNILSVYNPLYHYLIGLLDSNLNSFLVGRAVSLICWVLSLTVLYLIFRARVSADKAILVPLLMMFPVQSGLLVDLVQISPAALMFLLFVSALALIELTKVPTQIRIILVGILSVMSFLAKQQGGITFCVIVIFLILKKTKLQQIFSYLIVYFGILFIVIQVVNRNGNNNILAATIFDLPHYIETYWKLGILRLILFVGMNAFIIVFCLKSIFLSLKRKQFDIWQISFIVHIPFLLFILRNGGGGSNYFATFWVTSVCVFFRYLYRENFIEESKAPITRGLIQNSIRKIIIPINKPSSIHIVFIIFFIFLGEITFIRDVRAFSLPNAKLVNVMKEAYGKTQDLIGDKSQITILTNRNVGAFLDEKIIISDEGCSFFGAWKSSDFDKNRLLIKIRNRDFDYITTGLQPYPKDVFSEIEANYHRVYSSEINLMFGKTGQQVVFEPNI